MKSFQLRTNKYIRSRKYMTLNFLCCASEEKLAIKWKHELYHAFLIMDSICMYYANSLCIYYANHLSYSWLPVSVAPRNEHSNHCANNLRFDIRIYDSLGKYSNISNNLSLTNTDVNLYKTLGFLLF